MDRREAVTTLRAIAAVGEKLANDVEGGRLWGGEYSAATAQLSQYMRDLPGEGNAR